MKSLKSIIVTTIILTLICGIATAGLAFTNDFTAGRIEKLAAEAEQKAMGRVIDADKFDKNTVELNGEQIYYTAVKNGETVGYIVTVSTSGYGGAVKVMTGIGLDGKVIAIEVLDASNETPGLGQNVAKESFWEQFKGQSGQLEVKQEITPITSATISSKAVTKCVNEALKLYDAIAKEDGSNG